MPFSRYRDNTEDDAPEIDRTVSILYTDNREDHDVGYSDDYSFQVRHSLPASEELKTDALPRRRPMSKRLMGLIVISVFALVAIISMSVAIAARRSKNNVDASGAKKDLTPGDQDEFWERHPDQDLTQRFQNVANFLNRYKYTNLKLMSTKGTAQYMAVDFMANFDPAELDMPESADYDEAMQFVQRYIVALFYYSTNGVEWENQLNFLTSDNVCDWNAQVEDTGEAAASVGEYDGWQSGVRCNSDGEVNYIFIRTYHSNRVVCDVPRFQLIPCSLLFLLDRCYM